MSTIRITQDRFDELKKKLFAHAPEEAAAFLLAGVMNNSTGTHFTVREIMYPEAEEYDVQEKLSLQVSAMFFNRVISRAERENLAVVMCHTHPFPCAELSYSWSDDSGEAVSARTLHECLGGKPVGSLLIGQTGIAGRIWRLPNSDPLPIHEIRLLGRQFRVITLERSNGNARPYSQEIYARQILAFGTEGQRFLGALRVAVVGLGGTGSCVAEGLARLGVSDFVLVDNDVVEQSNITRVYGTTYKDAVAVKPRRKTAVAKDNILRIRPKAQVKALPISVIGKKAVTALKECDVIFSCTDTHSSRAIVNEICYQCYIPIIDIGVALNTEGGCLSGGSARVSLCGPGLPCLYCQHIIRPEMILSETLPEHERTARQDEGYIPGIAEAPSVVSFTTLASGLGVSLFLDLLFPFMGDHAQTIIIELNPLSLRRVQSRKSDDCVCDKRDGRGDFFPFSVP